MARQLLTPSQKTSRDSRFDPTEGYFLELDETFSGLGGDVKFLRSKFSAAYYKPLLFKSVILGLAGEFGHISGLGDKVTQSKRFILVGEQYEVLMGLALGRVMLAPVIVWVATLCIRGVLRLFLVLG